MLQQQIKRAGAISVIAIMVQRISMFRRFLIIAQAVNALKGLNPAIAAHLSQL